MTVASGRKLRRIVLAIGAVEAVILIAFLVMMLRFADTSDPLGRSIGMGMAQLSAVPICAFVLPAMLLGYLNRWLRLALGLLVLSVPFSIFLWLFA